MIDDGSLGFIGGEFHSSFECYSWKASDLKTVGANGTICSFLPTPRMG